MLASCEFPLYPNPFPEENRRRYTHKLEACRIEFCLRGKFRLEGLSFVVFEDTFERCGVRVNLMTEAKVCSEMWISFLFVCEGCSRW